MKNRNKEILLQITAGRGPAECCWVVAQVLKLLLQEAKQCGLGYSVIDREAGPENATLYSAAVLLQGERADAFVRSWEGSLLWTGQSPYRRYHKRKNWFVGISRLELSVLADKLEERDIRYEATRAGGPGGQHVNKVSTAVRATHLPSGLCMLASESRSQLQNKKAARERLEKLLANRRLQQQQEKIRSGWQQHLDLERGNPVRVFRGTDFKPHHQPDKHREACPALKRDWKKQFFDND